MCVCVCVCVCVCATKSYTRCAYFSPNSQQDAVAACTSSVNSESPSQVKVAGIIASNTSTSVSSAPVKCVASGATSKLTDGKSGIVVMEHTSSSSSSGGSHSSKSNSNKGGTSSSCLGRHDLRISIDKATPSPSPAPFYPVTEEPIDTSECIVEDYLYPEVMNLKSTSSAAGAGVAATVQSPGQTISMSSRQSGQLKSPPLITVKDAAGNTFFSPDRDEISLYGTPKEEVTAGMASEVKSSYMRQQIESR